MAAYAIFLREETQDQAELDAYAASITPVFEQFSPTVLAAYGAQEVVEGPAIEGVVLVRFPTYALASAWYHSPEYQAIVGHRLKGARYRGIIFDGVDGE
jgi:uncharacterized protein (DUF1330 family)